MVQEAHVGFLPTYSHLFLETFMAC